MSLLISFGGMLVFALMLGLVSCHKSFDQDSDCQWICCLLHLWRQDKQTCLDSLTRVANVSNTDGAGPSTVRICEVRSSFPKRAVQVSDAISEKVDSLKKGRSSVIESNHTLILGWSEKLVSNELLLSAVREHNSNLER